MYQSEMAFFLFNRELFDLSQQKKFGSNNTIKTNMEQTNKSASVHFPRDIRGKNYKKKIYWNKKRELRTHVYEANAHGKAIEIVS